MDNAKREAARWSGFGSAHFRLTRDFRTGRGDPGRAVPSEFPSNAGKRKIRRAVDKGLRRWEKAGGHSKLDVGMEVSFPMPRREVELEDLVAPPMMDEETHQASLFSVAGRFLRYGWGAARWISGNWWDKLRRRASERRRAVRLRQQMERLGGAAVKVGQQLAMRIDLMPYVYGVELSKMLDKVPPFPVDHAVAKIEETIGGKIDETFSFFDPEPIGSASVACVYRAYLKDGRKVALKVRRPGIGRTFVADCRALGMVLWALEALTLIRPGLTENFLTEFRNMLLEELDFVKEARSTELFRRRVRRKLGYVSAPRVHFELSSRDVLATEFVSGVWLGDMIAAVEQQDEAALQYLRDRNIDPKTVARRLIRTNQFGIFENLLFHADPHPSNVLVRPNNQLVFIDFGATGAYTSRERNNWRQLAYYHSKEDVGRMVQSALAILEPLPPIDIDEFAKRLEAVFWHDLYAFRSRHSQWWERTSVRIWMSFLNLAREYEIPMNLNTLRMIRSTLLYETVAARLYPRVNAYREHRKYNRGAGARARKRVRRRVHKRLFGGPTRADYLRFEQLWEMANRSVYLFQRILDTPLYRFSLLISKAVYCVQLTLKVFLFLLYAGATLAVALIAWRWLVQDQSLASIDLFETARDVLTWRPFQLALALFGYLQLRRVVYRLWDKDVKGDNTSGLT